MLLLTHSNRCHTQTGQLEKSLKKGLLTNMWADFRETEKGICHIQASNIQAPLGLSGGESSYKTNESSTVGNGHWQGQVLQQSERPTQGHVTRKKPRQQILQPQPSFLCLLWYLPTGSQGVKEPFLFLLIFLLFFWKFSGAVVRLLFFSFFFIKLKKNLLNSCRFICTCTKFDREILCTLLFPQW